jgi:hypothetical protein
VVGGHHHGFKYHDATSSADGIRKILLQSSADNRTKIIVKGKGAALAVDPPSFALPVTAQLTSSAWNVCWSAAYDIGAVRTNQTGVFKAKSTSP